MAGERTDGQRRRTDEPSAEVNGSGRGPLVVRYCGGCDPRIDRVEVAASVRAAFADQPVPPVTGATQTADGGVSASGPGRAASGVDGSPAPPTLLVSGCQRACASDHRLALAGDDAAVVVAGEHVDGVATPERRLAETAARRLRDGTAAGPRGRRGSPGRQTDEATGEEQRDGLAG